MGTRKIRPNKPPADPLDTEIWRAIMGEPSSWPVDSTYPPTGEFEADYHAGDKQMLLWAINDAAQRGKPVPAWAAQALRQVMFDMAKGKYASWEEAFGQIYGRAKKGRVRQGGIRTKARMFEVDRHVDGRPVGTTVDDAVSEAGRQGIGGKTTAYGLRRLARRRATKSR